MAEGTDCRFRGAFQVRRERAEKKSLNQFKNHILYRTKGELTPCGHTGKKVFLDKFRSTNHYYLRCLESTLGLRPSAFKEVDSRGANQISMRESGTLNG